MPGRRAQATQNQKSTPQPATSTQSLGDGYTWVNGFTDFFVFLKDHILFSITFFIFHAFIFYILVASYNRRMEPIQREICQHLATNQSHYYNGFQWLPMPQGDLSSIHNRIIEKVRAHSSLLVEDLLQIAAPATLEQAEAAVEMKGEFFIHYYGSVISCENKVQPNNNLMIAAFVYVGLFSLFLVYIVSPFSNKY